MTSLQSKIQGLWAHGGFRRYFKNTSWMFFGQFVAMAASFLVSVFLARYLGPQGFGLLNYVISFSVIFTFLAGMGVDSVINRAMVRDPEASGRYLGAGFLIKMLGSVACLALIFLVTLSVGMDSYTRSLIMLFALSFLFQSFFVIAVFFQARVQSKANSLALIMYNAVSVAVKIMLIIIGADVVWFVAAYALDSAISAFFYFLMYRLNGFRVSSWKFEWPVIRSVLSDSWPLMFSSLAVAVYMKIDQVMIGSMIGDFAVGIYAAAAKLSEVWYFIPTIICASLFPAIVNAQKSDRAVFISRMKRLYSLMFWPALILAVAVSLFSSPLISVFFGAQYAASSAVLSIHSWSAIGFFLNVAVTQYLISENYNRIALFTAATSAVLNIVLNLLWIPAYGAVGAAMATLIAYGFGVVGMVFFKRTRRQLVYLVQGIFFRF